MKAIALISGGLDSILAARVAKEAGIEVIPIYFKTPFCHRLKKSPSPSVMVKDNLGTDLKIVDISREFLDLLIGPRYGFGSNMNPCIDCKILMLKKAKEMMEPYRADFVVTGEVLGQRPMSQHRQALELIEKKSGLEGLLLRPLSAKLMPQTLPEKEGQLSGRWMLDFSGRSRRPQIELAEKLRIKDYPNASGGCLLTDPEFCGRLKDLIAHQELTLDNIELLKTGRHFRISQGAKLVIARDEKEGKALEGLVKEGDYLFLASEDLAGPTSLGRGKFNQGLIELSCRITCRYCDLNGSKEGEIMIRKGIAPFSLGTVPLGRPGYSSGGDSPYLLKVPPISERELKELRI